MTKFSEMGIDPYQLFVHTFRSNETSEKYQRSMRTFFDFIPIQGGNLGERCNTFVKCSKDNSKYALYHIFNFILLQKERYTKKEIVIQVNRENNNKEVKASIEIFIIKVIVHFRIN